MKTSTFYAVFNPKSKPPSELPIIYGFNNGGSPGWLMGVLLAEDGFYLGDHVCSDESYMLYDLGILEGHRPDRHKAFQSHYADGYRMEFVRHGDVPEHDGLRKAIELSKA